MYLTKLRASNETLKFKERLRVITRLSRNESHELLGAGVVGTVQGDFPQRLHFFRLEVYRDRISLAVVWKRIWKLSFRYLKCFSNKTNKRLVGWALAML